MKKAYTELGRLFYRDYEAQTGITMEDYQPWCDKVADAKNQIARLNEELEKIRAEAPEDEIPAEEAAVTVDVSGQSEEVPDAEATAEPAETTETAEQPEVQTPEEPPVGTLYVDVTNTEE